RCTSGCRAGEGDMASPEPPEYEHERTIRLQGGQRLGEASEDSSAAQRLVRGSRLGYTPSSQLRTAYRGALPRRGGQPAGRPPAREPAVRRLPRPAPRLLALVPLLAVLVTTACAPAPATVTSAPSQSAAAAAPAAVATGTSSAPASTSAVRPLDPTVSVA